jgi:hypothetical protein
LLKRFPVGDVRVLPGVQAAERGFSLEYLGGWSNTGYLELEVKSKQEHTSDGEEHSTSTKATNLPRPESMSSAPAENVAPAPISTHAKSAESPSESANVPQKPFTPPPAPLHTSPASSKLVSMSLLVKAVNSQDHLKGLKKTRGGIGSLKHDSSQKTMDSFFKKRRFE